jgi:hypothetical protein
MPLQLVSFTGVMTTADVDAHPEHPIYIPPPTPPTPEHPIVLPPLPPEEAGGIPTHPIYLPPVVWPPAGKPEHPIAPGGQPPQVSPPIAPGGGPSHPIAPGGQPPTAEHPIFIPGQPVHPIYLPGKPTHPIAPGGQPGVPTHPIYERDEYTWAWSPFYGWIILPPESAARPKPAPDQGAAPKRR